MFCRVDILERDAYTRGRGYFSWTWHVSRKKHPWTKFWREREIRGFSFLGRLPGFLFTRAKNDRKESSLWKRDLSFSLLFYLSFSFFHSSPFFLSTWSLISLVSKVRIPEENFFLRSPPRYLVSCLQRSRLSTLLNLNESFLTFILEIIVISTRVSIRQHMLERRKERKKERNPSSNKLVSNEWEELEDETRHPSKFSPRVSRLGVEWNSNRREPFPWN